MPHNKRYTESDLMFIKSNYDSMSVNDIAKHLDRSPKSVRAKIERLGLRLSSLERNLPYQWSDEQINFLKNNFESMSDTELSDSMNIPRGIILRKRHDLGLRHHLYKPYLNGEYPYQYIDGKRVCLHRNAIEQKIGRPLTKEERIHHIDGDKTNYDVSNLYLCSNRSEHGDCHASLESVAFELVRKGVIKFDSDNGNYYL